MVHGKERPLVREIERYIGESVRVDVIPGLEPSARPERSFDKSRGGKGGYGKSAGYSQKPFGEKKFGDKPAGDRPWGEKKWGDKPRGESQGYGQRDVQAPRHDDDNRGNSVNYGAGNAQGRPAREGNTWNRPEKNGNTWVKPEVRAAAKEGNHWGNKSDARPAFKSGPRSDDHRPAAAPKPRGRQSW